MTKKAKTTKKTATKATTRNRIDWAKFFKLCQDGLTNQEVADRMGYTLDKNSDDPLKPIRAMRSRAQTVGVRIEGKLQKLHAPRSGSVEKKAKAKAAKPAKKPKAAKAAKRSSEKVIHALDRQMKEKAKENVEAATA